MGFHKHEEWNELACEDMRDDRCAICMSEQLLEMYIETRYLWRLENFNTITEDRLTFLVPFEHWVVGVIKITKNPNNHNQV
jgi:hypothetical protein